jgi:hypothetical protein
VLVFEYEVVKGLVSVCRYGGLSTQFLFVLQRDIRTYIFFADELVKILAKHNALMISRSQNIADCE